MHPPPPFLGPQQRRQRCARRIQPPGDRRSRLAQPSTPRSQPHSTRSSSLSVRTRDVEHACARERPGHARVVREGRMHGRRVLWKRLGDVEQRQVQQRLLDDVGNRYSRPLRRQRPSRLVRPSFSKLMGAMLSLARISRAGSSREGGRTWGLCAREKMAGAGHHGCAREGFFVRCVANVSTRRASPASHDGIRHHGAAELRARATLLPGRPGFGAQATAQPLACWVSSISHNRVPTRHLAALAPQCPLSCGWPRQLSLPRRPGAFRAAWSPRRPCSPAVPSSPRRLRQTRRSRSSRGPPAASARPSR